MVKSEWRIMPLSLVDGTLGKLAAKYS